MKKGVALLVLVALLGLLGWKVYRKVSALRNPSGRKGRTASVAVEVAPVRKGTIRNIERFSGTLRPRSQFSVAPRIGGRLAKLLVDVADPVARGQLIAVLDDEEYAREVEQSRAELEVAKANAEQIRLLAEIDDDERVQQVAQAQAELGIAKAKLEETRSAMDVARRELERAQTLHQKKVLAASELDAIDAKYKAAKAKNDVSLAQVTEREAALKATQVRLSETQKNARAAEYKLALAQVAQKEAALKAAEVRLAYTQIKVTEWNDAENGRVVGERFVDAGTMLKANEPIVSVLDIQVLKAVVHVTERDYSKVRAGQDVVVITDAFPGRTFTGQIVRVSQLLKEASRQASVEIDVPNAKRLLKPGMFIRAQIEFAAHENVTIVPFSGLARRERRQGVFVADKEKLKAHFVPVTVGIVEGGLAEVVSPPKRLENASVVVLGQHLLEDGSAITLPDAKPGAPPAEGGAPEPSAERTDTKEKASR